MAERFGLTIFEMGAELRNMIASESELGMKIKQTVESGNLVDDETIMEVVDIYLDRLSNSHAILFDGIPRTLGQSEMLLERLANHGRQASAVLITVSEQVAIERMMSRGRQDDTEDVMRRRLDHYQQQTVPVIESFRTAGHLVEVNGEQGIEQVAADLAAGIEPLM
ncbi:nucleoside monophosphate kinase [Candidatus Peregrinibacteria bacterium]|nr:MAG: nucleoside monophosphate kinase [Candidatus Peregrinibacteria bacterium]